MRSSDDTIDVRLRITRAENPFLFKAVSELEAGPGVGLRNGFIKQLAEVGLMVHEERMRREPGVSTRTAGGLTAALSDHLSGAGAGVSVVMSAPAPIGRVIAAAPPAQNAAAEPAAVEPAGEPAPVRSSQPATGDAAPPLPIEESRSPSRVTGSGTRRVLGGYAND